MSDNWRSGKRMWGIKIGFRVLFTKIQLQFGKSYSIVKGCLLMKWSHYPIIFVHIFYFPKPIIPPQCEVKTAQAHRDGLCIRNFKRSIQGPMHGASTSWDKMGALRHVKHSIAHAWSLRKSRQHHNIGSTSNKRENAFFAQSKTNILRRV